MPWRMPTVPEGGNGRAEESLKALKEKLFEDRFYLVVLWPFERGIALSSGHCS